MFMGKAHIVALRIHTRERLVRLKKKTDQDLHLFFFTHFSWRVAGASAPD